MDEPIDNRQGAMAGGLLLWLLAFMVWERLAAIEVDMSLWLRIWCSGAVCALSTLVLFAPLAAQPPARRSTIAWGLGAAVVVLAFAAWGRDLGPHTRVVANLPLLAAALAAGTLFGNMVDSKAYFVPLLFAASVQAAARLYAARWFGAAEHPAGYDALWFPIAGTRSLAPMLHVSDLVLLATFLRAIERLGMGLGQGRWPAVVSLVVFALASGVAAWRPCSTLFMVGVFIVLCRPEPEPDSRRVGGAVAFGLSFACLMALLACAGSIA